MEKITVCELDKCAGCMACVDACAVNAIKIVDNIKAYNAVIDTEKCIKCGRCHNICQNNRKLDLCTPIDWLQGWIADEELRLESSSGGAAAALTRSFIQSSGTVCSCVFHNGEFCFEFANKIEDADCFKGSKYVKSNARGIYNKILKKLRKGEKILFIGLPCQVSALKIYIGTQYQQNLYTVDLICHGTPSLKVLEDFLKQYGYELKDIDHILFRHKRLFNLDSNYNSMTQPGAVDSYLLAFLCSLDYTENCYHCRYAGINRVSDLTLGDSWGSELSKQEQEKGISLILCQNEKGKQLLQNAEMKLFPVNKDIAVSRQHQLREPSIKDRNSELFFKFYPEKHFNYAVSRSLFSKTIKQKIKALLLKKQLIQKEEINYTVSIKMKK